MAYIFSNYYVFRQTRIDWSGFSKLRNDETQKIEAAICNNCKKVFQTISEHRFQDHRNNCSRGRMKNDLDPNDLNCSMDVDQDNCNPDLDIDNLQKFLHILLVKFFVTANIPFKQVENKYFLDFIEALIKCPFNYKPPCRTSLSTTVLAQLHQELQKKKYILLNETDSVMLIDGWKNKTTNQKLLVFSLRNVNTFQTFFKYCNFTQEKEDGENLAKFISEAIIEAKEKYQTNVYAVVTDNDSKVVRGVRLAKTTDNRPLIQSTCSSHSGNLLIKSFVDDDLVKMIREIINTFKVNCTMESLLLSRGGTKLRSLADTRFCFLRDTCFSIVKNIDILIGTCESHEPDVPPSVKHYLKDATFRKMLTDIVNTLDPICRLINTCQSPDCNVADAAEAWLSLRMPTDEYDEIISSRKDKCIWPVVYAANLLHNKYRGKLLNEAQKMVAKEFLDENMNAQVKKEYKTFQETQSNHQFYDENCDDVISYWKLIGWTLPLLSKFVVKLMVLQASTALLESVFSNWTYLHNSWRNRLGEHKSACLVDIYYTLTRKPNI